MGQLQNQIIVDRLPTKYISYYSDTLAHDYKRNFLCIAKYISNRVCIYRVFNKYVVRESKILGKANIYIFTEHTFQDGYTRLYNHNV